MSMKLADRFLDAANSAAICVIFPGALGDFICFLPALRALASRHRIVLYARSEFAELVPAAVTVRSIERREISRLFVATPELEVQVRQSFEAFAVVYSWMGHQQPTFAERLQAASGGRALIFPFRPAARAEHQADYYLRCLGVGEVSRGSTVEVSRAADDWGERFWRDHLLCGRAVLMIAPGSGAREKNWPEAFFIEVADWWAEATEGIVLFLFGPVEAERGGFDRLREHGLGVSPLGLAQTAALLQRSTVYLGNDSGISHLAAAVGTRTVALFGPSDPVQWAPRGRVSVIRRCMDCSPCSEPTMKSCPHRGCLTELSPAQVIDVMRQVPELASLTRGGAGITV